MPRTKARLQRQADARKASLCAACRSRELLDEGAIRRSHLQQRVEGGEGDAAERVGDIKTLLQELDVEVRELQAAVDYLSDKRGAMQTQIHTMKKELAATVDAPVSEDRDPTEWLPDELMLMVLGWLPSAVLWSGVCEHVCQRWERLMKSAPIVRAKGDKWGAAARGDAMPRCLEPGPAADVDMRLLAIGLDGRAYSGSWSNDPRNAVDNVVKVWCGVSGAHLQTLHGHTRGVGALAVRLDGSIYSGSDDFTVRVWSGVSGEHLRTLEGHTGCVNALAVGLDGKIYSGSSDTTIRVWADSDGTHVQTLKGHVSGVNALAVGRDGAIYSGGWDTTIMVWSGKHGLIFRVRFGHNGVICALAMGLDGMLYSGSRSGLLAWPPDADDDDDPLTMLNVHHGHHVNALVVGPDGRLFAGSSDGTVHAWSGENGPAQAQKNVSFLTLKGAVKDVCALAVGRDGALYSAGAPADRHHPHTTRLERW
jgi:hypothetical protein